MMEMREDKGRYLALTIVMIGVFMSVLDAVSLNIALPSITSYFQVAVADTQWVVTSYLLVQTCFLIISGKVSERTGQARMFTLGLLVFSTSSLLCALSSNLWQLIMFRVMQGLGASMMFSVSTAIIFRIFDVRGRGKALGFLGSTVSLGGMLGPVIGGVLVGTLGWQSIFLVNVPIGLIAAVLAVRALKVEETISDHLRMDYLGAVLWVVSIGSLVLMLGALGGNGALTTENGAYLLVFLVTILLFVLREREVAEPLLDISVFKIGRFSLITMSMAMFFMSMSLVIILGPFYYEGVLVYGPATVGAIFMILPAITMFGSLLVGRIYDKRRLWPYTTVAHLVRALGFFLMAYGFLSLSLPLTLVAFAVMGLGSCLFQTPNNAEMMLSLPMRKSGLASSIQATTRNLSMAVGISLATIFMTVLMGSMDYGAIAGGPLAGELARSVTIAVAFGGVLSMVGAMISRLSEKGIGVSWRSNRTGRS